MTVWMQWARRLCLAACSSACLAAWAQDEVPFITTPDSVTLAMLQAARQSRRAHRIHTVMPWATRGP